MPCTSEGFSSSYVCQVPQTQRPPSRNSLVHKRVAEGASIYCHLNLLFFRALSPGLSLTSSAFDFCSGSYVRTRRVKSAGQIQL